MESHLQTEPEPQVRVVVANPAPAPISNFDRRVAFYRRLLGVEKPAVLARVYRAHREARPLMRIPPASEADPGHAPPESPGFLAVAKDGRRLFAQVTDCPSDQPPPRVIPPFIAIVAGEPFASGTLTFLVTFPGPGIDPAAVRVGGWVPRRKRFEVIPHSGFNAAGGYAFAHVTRSGIYAVVLTAQRKPIR